MLEIVFFDTEAIIFEPSSSSLHLVSDMCAQLLILIEKGASKKELIDYLCINYVYEYQESVFFVERSIEALQSLEIIEGHLI